VHIKSSHIIIIISLNVKLCIFEKLKVHSQEDNRSFGKTERVREVTKKVIINFEGKERVMCTTTSKKRSSQTQHCSQLVKSCFIECHYLHERCEGRLHSVGNW